MSSREVELFLDRAEVLVVWATAIAVRNAMGKPIPNHQLRVVYGLVLYCLTDMALLAN